MNFRLVTLGRLSLIRADGVEDESLARRKRKLALLAVLATSRRPLTRAALVEMFWGEQTDDRARHSLNDALSHLRRVLGHDAITIRQSDVELGAGVVTVDTHELAAAAAAGDFTRAVDLYGGDFLEGVEVPGSPSFEQWRDREQTRLQNLFVEIAQRSCGQLIERQEWERCVQLSQRWLQLDPLSADAALTLLRCYQQQRTPSAYREAAAAHRLLRDRLRQDFDAEPDPRINELASQLEHENALQDRARGVSRFFPTSRGKRRSVAAVAGVIMITAAIVVASRRNLPAEPVSVAIIDVTSMRADTADAWLETGIPQMIAADLARIEQIEVVPPERVRQTLARAELLNKTVSEPQAADIGRRLHAKWVVTGGISHSKDAYVLDLSVHDSRTGAVTRLFTVSDTSVIALTDKAAARLAALDELNNTPLRFANIETSSIDAYRHFLQALKFSNEGNGADAMNEYDRAIALDSMFASAIRARAYAAFINHDTKTYETLTRRLTRIGDTRGSEFDALTFETRRAFQTSQHERAETLARRLVARFPNDPRAYNDAFDVFMYHGKTAVADSIARRILALDSLGMTAGKGPCAPCLGYDRLAIVRGFEGDLQGNQQLLQRWLQIQPNSPNAWHALGDVLAYRGDVKGSVAAHAREHELGQSTDDMEWGGYLAARRYDVVDSIIKGWEGRPDKHSEMIGARAALQRELGQMRASIRTLEDKDGLAQIRANSMARVGDYARARELMESITEHRAPAAPVSDVLISGPAGQARAFIWHHALIADAIAPSADTLTLRAIADSMRTMAPQSYYGRDWRVYHHVLGLIAMKSARYAEAEREFKASLWGHVGGWTVSTANMARAQMAQGKYREALSSLREAYHAPFNAMGHYQIRSELDLLMSQTFAKLGQRDSAMVYGNYVRRAWRNADPEIKTQLASLPPSTSSAGRVLP